MFYSMARFAIQIFAIRLVHKSEHILDNRYNQFTKRSQLHYTVDSLKHHLSKLKSVDHFPIYFRNGVGVSPVKIGIPIAISLRYSVSIGIIVSVKILNRVVFRILFALSGQVLYSR